MLFSAKKYIKNVVFKHKCICTWTISSVPSRHLPDRIHVIIYAVMVMLYGLVFWEKDVPTCSSVYIYISFEMVDQKALEDFSDIYP